MSSIAEAIAVAVQYHQAGQLDAAEQIYRKILAIESQNADALHLSGVIASQRGRYHEAVDLIGRAIAVSDHEPGYHMNLGNALNALGRATEAIACYERAVTLQPDLAAAYNNLGNAYWNEGRLNEAIVAYRRAVELSPTLAQAYSNLGAILKSQTKLEEAQDCLHRAVQLMPNLAEAHNNLGCLHEERGHLDDAAACYRRAVEIRPDFAAAQNNLGHALQQQGEVDQAALWFERAVASAPGYAEALSNLGAVYKAQGKLDEAVAAYERAIALRPDLLEVHSNLGNALHAMRQVERAAASYRRALEINPDYPEAHFSQSFLMLQRGDFEHGWPEYEWRWKTKEFKSLALGEPTWSGQRVGSLLLHTDQGLGDTLQFVRLVPLVKQWAEKVLLRCPNRLMPLLRSCHGVDEMISPDASLPEFDAQAYLTSLPGPMNITLERIPRAVPYLHASERLVQQWRTMLPPGFRVGIAWQGNPKFKGDRTRSIPLAEFAPLAEVSGVKLISLQKGFGAEQCAAMKGRFQVIDLGPDVDEQHGAFMDTAAIMLNLDVVVTSDTSIAHLAGALGVPVWVALSFMPEWRWFLDRGDSPWYPTMRLFRQRQPGDWAGVFIEMKEALVARLASEKSSG